ncbi:GTPase activating-like protein [Heterobasidion irregulare TC 32-1]|uniref:GTPase activating-like protein n=1 Tax=Heterobasidion irregulare (strain TC 32-1) TaxID=747525 RepID=W4JNQ2_HETIT|nr:GTPase activating-like protein [Heterobasidion irregulare TC 32-1]ETW74695.1 GTPase activating-like protein [Heterobasidion irregulare TC 32-1]
MDKRSSQITYHAGFVNRMSDFSPPPTHASTYAHAATSLTKGWKPFKLVLRGTKLQFYKPPYDRVAAVKELFPIGVVSVDEEEEAEAGLSDVVDDTKAEAKPTPLRRRRAYWGRRMHPDLVIREEAIEKGTLEALVHEAVFATTFRENGLEAGPIDTRTGEWQDFASAILFALPTLVGAGRFETELLRCCAYLVSGAEDLLKEIERGRVQWLANEYVRYHGSPADPSAWETFRKETIPDCPKGFWQLDASAHRASSSTQALYSRSPKSNASTNNPDSFSPNVNTFSPRPGAGDVMGSLTSMADMLAPILPGRKSTDLLSRPSMSSNKDIIWSTLEREGFTKEVLLRLSPRLVARSLLIFNRNILESLPENLTADNCLLDDSSTGRPLPVASDAQVEDAAQKVTVFFGSDDRPHWLTKLVILHILGPDSPSFTSRMSGDQAPQTSRTHTRSEVISAWVRAGELSRLAGDHCSWQAIRAALCSRPIARLEKAWKRVDTSSISVVESWIKQVQGFDRIGGVDVIMTPWGGDLHQKIRTALDRAKVGGEEVWTVGKLTEAKDLFEGFRTSFSLCPRKNNPLLDDVSEDIERLASAWKDLCISGGGKGNIASQFIHVDQFMSLSIAAESRRKGLYEPYFWSPSALSTSPTNHTLASLLFPEHLPEVSLINRSQVWRGRLESGATQLSVQDVQFLRSADSASKLASSQKRKSLGTARDGLNGEEFGGTIIPIFDGELLLLVQPGAETSISPTSSRPPSRPSSSVIDPSITEKPMSRAPSIRVKAGSHAMDRKASLARRSSLPSISQRASVVLQEHPSERPVRVVVKAGTLERLVEVLAHGLPGISVSIADDNGEMPLREGVARDIRLDRSDFASIWWNVYRSFVTPLVFFELLRKRYVSASLAGQSAVAELQHIAQVRSEILEAISEWIQLGGGAQDILDDGPLFHAVQAFFNSPTDHEMPDSPAKDDLTVSHAWSSLNQTRASVTTLLTCQTMRPTIQSLSYPEIVTNSSLSEGFGIDPPDLDNADPEGLVNNFDAMASAAFRNVTEEDLFVTADLLEVQTADRMGWLLPRDASTTNDDVEIQTIYSYISEIEPSTLISELTHDSIFRLLPPGLRSCLRAHHVLRKWVVSQIVAPRLGLQVRQARMELLLQAVEICRRSSLSDSPDGFPEKPSIRSFVEFVLTSAIISAESRIHQRAWYNVANARKVGCESLVAFLAKPVCQPSTPKWPLATDMGWTLERMLELISLPDVHESLSPEGRPLVNFDKRRQLCNLISNTPCVSRSRLRRDIDRRDFERLGNIEREVGLLQFDLRSTKEDAYRELSHAGVSGPPKRAQRPFQKHVSAQHEKNKRDRYLRDRLSKERKQEQLKNDRKDEYLNKAMHTRRPYTAAQRQHRIKKSASSGFFQQLMRPISSAFSLDNVDSSSGKRTAAELDFTPTGKPSLVLNVVDAQVAHFINRERSYTFQLDTEDGGHYLLQAASKVEMIKWIQTIDRVSKSAAKRRLTYLGNSPKPQLSDHIHERPKTASRDPTATVFGVDLEFLLKREAGGNPVPQGAVPSVIERCLQEVEARGLSEVGIYRIAGASSEVNGLKEKLNRGEWPITLSTDIYAVCDIIKTWFRVLPEPVFPSYSYHDVIEAMKIEDLNSRIERIRTVIQALHRHNFDLLKRVVEHLDRVTDYEEHNQMGSDALAIVFSPNLLRAPHNDFVMIMANMQHTNRLVKALVTHFHTIFDEIDPDAEGDHDEDEDEFELPIPEEDEEADAEFLRSAPIIYPGSENSLVSQIS